MCTLTAKAMDTDAIFSKPGRYWSREEYDHVWEWLYRSQQLDFLLLFALRKLGYAATPEDAEDTLQEFLVTRLDSEIRRYDPARGRRFWSYLLMCFGQACSRKGNTIRKRQEHEIPLLTTLGTEAGELVRCQHVDNASNPEEMLIYRELVKSLNMCMESLSAKYRTVFQQHMEGLSIKETASRVGVSMGLVKVWRLRARRLIARCLQRKGWA